MVYATADIIFNNSALCHLSEPCFAVLLAAVQCQVTQAGPWPAPRLPLGQG